MIEQIKQILKAKSADFAQKIAPVFRILDLRWTTGIDYFVMVIPGESEITSLINQLIDGLRENSRGFYCERNGITVGYIVKNSVVQPVLQFIISELPPRIITTTAEEIKGEEVKNEKAIEGTGVEHHEDLPEPEDIGQGRKEN